MNDGDIIDINDCPICLEKMEENNVFVTNCNHKFHISCIYPWILYSCDDYRTKWTCPLCRKVLPFYKCFKCDQYMFNINSNHVYNNNIIFHHDYDCLIIIDNYGHIDDEENHHNGQCFSLLFCLTCGLLS